MRRTIVLGLVMLLALSPRAWSQVESTSKERAVADFLTNATSKAPPEQEKAIEIFEKVLLKAHKGHVEQTPELGLIYCTVLWEVAQKKGPVQKKKAEEECQKFVDRNPQNPEGRFLYAKILSTQKKEEAKEQILTAAQLGIAVLREIHDKKNVQMFGWLANDAKFVLECMKESNKTASASVARDFFKVPYAKIEKTGPGGEDPTKPPPTDGNDEIRAQLEKEVDVIFENIRNFLERSEYEALRGAIIELNTKIQAYQRKGAPEVVQRKLKEWENKYKEGNLGEILQALQLQLYVNEGETKLAEMETARKKEEFDQVFQKFQEVVTLVDKMRAVDREEYKRNADFLFYRAKEENDKAIKQKRIKELKLGITGIVLDKSPAVVGRQSGHRVVINDKIYKEGQLITDENEDPIDGLVVLEILEGSVKFKYQDTSFLRELTPRQE